MFTIYSNFLLKANVCANYSQHYPQTVENILHITHSLQGTINISSDTHWLTTSTSLSTKRFRRADVGAERMFYPQENELPNKRQLVHV